MALGEKLQELRKGKGISQEAFSEIMGVSRQAISKWELNQSYPEMEKLIEVSDYFQVSLDYLVKESVDEAVEESEQKNEVFVDKQENKFVDVIKMVLLAGIAIVMSSIRFFIMGDYRAGILLGILGCIIILGFYVTRVVKVR